MNQYQIEIKEELVRVETVEAESAEDAVEKVKALYYRQKIILDAEDMKGVTFKEV